VGPETAQPYFTQNSQWYDLVLPLNLPVHFFLIAERNPVTGEVYSIVSPASTPTKSVENGFAHVNGTSTPMANGNPEPVVNGNAATE
jgi:hypothetical protein